MSYKESERLLPAPAATTRLLPGAGNTARIAGQDRGIQAAYVNAKLQGIGCHGT